MAKKNEEHEQFSQEELIRIIEEKDKQIVNLTKKVDNLKNGLSEAFYTGRWNAIVSIHNSVALSVYRYIKKVTVLEARKQYGWNKAHPFDYVTTAKRLGDLLCLDQRTAREVLSDLVDMKAIKLVKRGEHKVCTYRLGERKPFKDGKGKYRMVDSFYCSLSGNKGTANFYAAAKEDLKTRLGVGNRGKDE